MRKVKGTLHWVSASHADATVRLYDRLFSVENPAAETDRDFRELLNPIRLSRWWKGEGGALSLRERPSGGHFQFQRLGCFTPDRSSTPDKSGV